MSNTCKRLSSYIKKIVNSFSFQIEFAKPISLAKENSIILFPTEPNTLHCGISALVAFKKKAPAVKSDLDILKNLMKSMKKNSLVKLSQKKSNDIEKLFLGGDALLNDFFEKAQGFKQEALFFNVFFDMNKQTELGRIAQDAFKTIETENNEFKARLSSLCSTDVKIISNRLEHFKDIGWCLKNEVLDNIARIKDLAIGLNNPQKGEGAKVFKRINAVLNSIDRLEVRGRDSAGISIVFTFQKEEFEVFKGELKKAGLSDSLKQRTNRLVLTNNTITINDTFPKNGTHYVSLSFVYKFAKEIGALGDNVAFIRSQIRNDMILQLLTNYPFISSTVSAHTRWASVGDITEANCHPLDNTYLDREIEKTGIIHVCLNGDIDNYVELKTDYEARYGKIHDKITTDTKLIPLQIEHYLKLGNHIEEAFRLALNDFEGSHAISMHTDLAPGKLFLAQKGSGQALFVGISPDHYIAASELYGVVEETQKFIKLNGQDEGQIVILDENSSGQTSGIRSFYYNNAPILIDEPDIQTSSITSRDIDRQDFPHYFLKEISEAPRSVENTIVNKFKRDPETNLFYTTLDTNVIPGFLEKELISKKIKRIYFIGQGTAGVAAQGCADLLNYYLGQEHFQIKALKASELSGSCININNSKTDSMDEYLVVAISQSGTTTDTNRTVDIVKSYGARTLCIVNRRDSDLTFKTDGVLYTSSGRDIEMSVASTKAFYSQLTAGAMLGLHIASKTGTRTNEFITEEINEIISLPKKMSKILDMKDQIKISAQRLAVTKNYWATVGSGANKTSADEIRIKLSELCYKTISSDYVEDKKHIDLSSEPLILICAAGTNESVLADILKDTAIFNAHKAATVVIVNEGEDRFDLYTKDIFKIPATKEHFAPILNTLVGHVWGYYAALAINDGSRFMYICRTEVKDLLDEYKSMGHDIYEILLEKKFREKIAYFYNKFSKRRRENGFPAAMGLDNAANITLLSKYLTGRLPVSDFEIDFGTKGTPSNMLNTFFDNLSQAINTMARPVDAIKHQAKTVTVGTSRITEQFNGVIFDELYAHNLSISQITNKNVLVMKNLQEILSKVKGSLLYQIKGLSVLGEVTQEAKIRVIKKRGSLKNESSRVESDPKLRGTKNIIVREGNVYIGKGRKDKRSILVIPVISTNPATPNIIEFILSLNVVFKTADEVSLLKKIKALGGKYTRLKDWVLESENIQWDDKFLNMVEIESLFGDTAEQVVNAIIQKIS